MRFWDAAAVVPLLVEEPTSAKLRRLYETDTAQSVWCLTPVEAWGAVARKRRASVLGSPDVREARRRLESLSRDWLEIHELSSVTRRALRLVEVHPLRAADALQLAAALVFVSDRPEGFEFVTLDSRLAEAAEAEAFRTIVPE
jgi:predicted nucleic acid-binding protein